MLAFLETLVSFIGVIVLCIFTVRVFKLSAGIAPIVVLSGSMMYFTLMGCLGILRLGGYAYFAICAAALIYIIVSRKKRSTDNMLTNPPFMLFCVLGLALLIYLAVRKPLLYQWDEYSLWGTAARLTSLNDALYTSAEFGWPWAATQKPGFALLSYLFNFFGSFAPWRMYFAYDLLIFSTACAAIGSMSVKKWNIVIPVALAALILPFITIYYRTIYFVPTYLSSYADIPMGLLMGGALAAYYHIVNTGKLTQLWAVGIILGGVALCKDTGLPLAFIAAGIMTIDILFCHKSSAFTLRPLHGAGAKAALAASYFAVPALCFIGWSKYLGASGVAQGNLGGESNLSPVGLLINGLKLLCGINNTDITAAYSDKFNLVSSKMLQTFFTDKICMFGSGLTTFIIMGAILAIILMFARDKLLKRSCVLYGVFASLGFLAYYVFIGFTYVFIFKQDGANLPDYNRYMSSYYSGMLLGAFALLCIAAAKGSKLRDLLTPACIGLATVMLAVFSIYIPKYLSIIDYPSIIYNDSVLLEKQCDNIKSVIEKDARIFFVSQKDDGRMWFEYSYELLPNILDYSWGGGRFAAPAIQPTESYYFGVSKDQLAAYLVESGCDYLLAQDLDDYFIESYGMLFSDNCTSYNEVPQLYKVELKEGYSIISKDNTDGEILRGGSDLTDKAQIRVMPDAQQYLQLVPVITEGVYE